MIRYFPDLIQGSDEWFAARCGMLTASEMGLIITPTLKVATNEKEKAHLYELLAQRITKYVEPSYVSDAMLRGHEDEVDARILYSDNFAPVEEMGFITNDEWGFTLGYSPDGLVGTEGQIECKSRGQRFQIRTLVESVPENKEPLDFMLQNQTGLLVSGREWVDFLSYSGGLHMAVIRVFPDDRIQQAIIDAAFDFERRLSIKLAKYHEVLASRARLVPTERRVEMEITL